VTSSAGLIIDGGT